MHFVGKILVVVQLVLVICFMAFAAAVSATQSNWKKAHAAVQTSFNKAQSDLNNARAEVEKTRNEAKQKETDLQSKVDQLQAQNILLNGKVDTLTLETDSLRTTSTTKVEVAAISANDALDRRSEAVLLRELYRKSQEAKDLEFREKNKLEDTKFELTLDLNKLKTDNVALLRENKKLKDVLFKHNLPTELKDYERLMTPPPDVVGIVLETKKTKQGSEIVEISIGSDEGLLEGHTLFVYHSGSDGSRPKYLGKLKIVHTAPDRAVGEVIDRAKNGIIQRGDNVTTKL